MKVITNCGKEVMLAGNGKPLLFIIIENGEYFCLPINVNSSTGVVKLFNVQKIRNSDEAAFATLYFSDIIVSDNCEGVVRSWLETCIPSKMFTVSIANNQKGFLGLGGKGTKLMLCGWGNMNRFDPNSVQYPMFGSKNPKVFFTKEKASEIVSELKALGYDCVVDV